MASTSSGFLNRSSSSFSIADGSLVDFLRSPVMIKIVVSGTPHKPQHNSQATQPSGRPRRGSSVSGGSGSGMGVSTAHVSTGRTKKRRLKLVVKSQNGEGTGNTANGGTTIEPNPQLAPGPTSPLPAGLCPPPLTTSTLPTPSAMSTQLDCSIPPSHDVTPSPATFYIHKDLLASRSPELHKHVYNNMKEGLEHTLVLRDVDVDVVERFVEWVYSGSYKSVVSATVGARKKTSSNGGLMQGGVAGGGLGPSAAHDQATCDALMLHARLYVFGDRFNIRALQDKAFRKLQARLKEETRKRSTTTTPGGSTYGSTNSGGYNNPRSNHHSQNHPHYTPPAQHPHPHDDQQSSGGGNTPGGGGGGGSSNGGISAQESYYRRLIDIVLYCFDNLPTTKSLFRRRSTNQFQASQGYRGSTSNTGSGNANSYNPPDQLLTFWIGFIAWKLHVFQRYESCFELLIGNQDITRALLAGTLQAASKPPWDVVGLSSIRGSRMVHNATKALLEREVFGGRVGGMMSGGAGEYQVNTGAGDNGDIYETESEEETESEA